MAYQLRSPGTQYGPCQKCPPPRKVKGKKDVPSHPECEIMRGQANTKCAKCGERIGYNADFEIPSVAGQDPYHTACDQPAAMTTPAGVPVTTTKPIENETTVTNNPTTEPDKKGN